MITKYVKKLEIAVKQLPVGLAYYTALGSILIMVSVHVALTSKWQFLFSLCFFIQQFFIFLNLILFQQLFKFFIQQFLFSNYFSLFYLASTFLFSRLESTFNCRCRIPMRERTNNTCREVANINGLRTGRSKELQTSINCLLLPPYKNEAGQPIAASIPSLKTVFPYLFLTPFYISKPFLRLLFIHYGCSMMRKHLTNSFIRYPEILEIFSRFKPQDSLPYNNKRNSNHLTKFHFLCP